MNFSLNAIIAELRAAGMAGDELVMAIERIGAASDGRSAAAIRQKRYRDKHGPPVTNNVTVTDAPLSKDNTNSILEVEHNLCTSEREGAHHGDVTRNARKSVTRGTRLSEDWSPRRNEIEFGRANGFTDQQITGMADHFRDHFLSSAARNAIKIDWDRAFLVWMRREMKEHKHHGPSSQHNTIAAGVGRVRDAINRATGGDRRGGENPEPISGLRESPRYVHTRHD